MNLILRPHHLLCTQSYEGRGYSPQFVENMDAVTAILRKPTPTRICLKRDTDSLCEKCPNKLGENQCRGQDHVKKIDEKVLQYFHLEEKEYEYQSLIGKIREEMKEEILEDICGECSWYQNDGCIIRECVGIEG